MCVYYVIFIIQIAIGTGGDLASCSLLIQNEGRNNLPSCEIFFSHCRLLLMWEINGSKF